MFKKMLHICETLHIYEIFDLTGTELVNVRC